MRQARLRAGLSLAQVAGAELTRQAVHLIETGKVQPSARSLQLIARRLGVPAHTFLAESAEGEPAQRRAAELERLCERQRYRDVVELAHRLLEGDRATQMEAVARLYLGRALAQLGRADEAVGHLRRARQLFEAKDPWSAAEAREWEAAALYVGESPRAEVAEDGLGRYRALEPRRPAIEARMLEHLGTILIQRRNYLRAHQCYEDALHVAGPVLDLLRLGHIYHGLSRCHASLGDMRRAIELASRAVALYAVENDLRPVPARMDLPRAENDLSMMLIRDRQLDRAEELVDSALAHLDEAGAQRLRGYLLLTLAEVRQLQRRQDEALLLIDQAIDLAERLNERAALAAAHRQLGEVREERGEHDQADRCFERALAVLAEAGTTGPREECLAAYRGMLEARGDVDRLERIAG
ncbi:MAG TPA: tetratricopeptide repeat protein [Candidatus Eisenbacteria bacterium]|nr:tetratricopeptide repeat protein [Candidatus Eisenbacteria bacterium]